MRWALILLAIIALPVAALLLSAPAEAPTAFWPPVFPPAPESRTYSLLFAGDIMLDRSVRRQIERAQDPLYPFLRIADTLAAADFTFGNLEGPVSARGADQGSQYSFRFEPAGTVHALRFAGFDAVSIANNHIWDWGREALIDTVAHLNAAGIGTVGAGANSVEANAPFVFGLGKTNVALLGYTNLFPKGLEATADQPGISSFSIESAGERIAELKRQGTDIIIVSFHWGTEYETRSDAGQQRIARALIDAGADLIIGHHPHVVQEVERYKDGWIAYSLGNFVFDQYFSPETMSGLMVRAFMRNGKIEGIEQIPVKLTPTFQPYIPGQPGDPALDIADW